MGANGFVSTIGNQAQGPLGSLFQDRDRNEATRTRVTADQSSSVYIGQVVKHIVKIIFIKKETFLRELYCKYYRINLLTIRSTEHPTSFRKSST